MRWILGISLALLASGCSQPRQDDGIQVISVSGLGVEYSKKAPKQVIVGETYTVEDEIKTK